MTTFVYTWNASFLATPADTEDESLGAQRIRDTKGAFGERFAVDHILDGTGQDGKHYWNTLHNLGTPGIMVLDTGDGRVFAAANGTANTELWYQDSNGAQVQLTSNGTNTGSSIPAGTRMLFAQSAPPTGWTLQNVGNDMMIRLNSATGAGTGGSWAISGLSVGSHVLTVDEIPAHTHGLPDGAQMVADTYPSSNVSKSNTGPGNGFSYYTFSSQGGGQGHNHTASGDGSWRPAYFDVIVAQKN